MTKELEIEFKNLLTKEEYLKLLDYFNYSSEDAFSQVNHYFDTKDFHLKHNRTALRIREKENYWECTLKKPAPVGKFEITDSLNKQQAESMLKLQSFDAPEVETELHELGIFWNDLQLIGSLTTNRIELEFLGGLLVLDHSTYLDQEDFEVEFEVTDAVEGQKQFTAFLMEQKIPTRKTLKKIARFMQAARAANS